MNVDRATERPLLRRSVIYFFLLAYGISWAVWGLLILFPEVLGEMAFMVILGAFGPWIAAALLTRRQQGKDQAKSWRQGILRLRGRLGWILLGGLGLPILIALVHIIWVAVSKGLPPLQSDPPWYWLLPAIPVNVYLVFFYSSAFGEEPGWQGYAMPRLLKIFPPFLANVILGLLWALWHLPLFFTPLWKGEEPLLWMVIYAVPLAIIMTWLTQKARGSVMPAVFFHYATNLYGSYLLGTEIFQTPLSEYFTEIKTLLYWIIALIILWQTRGSLGYDKHNQDEQ